MTMSRELKIGIRKKKRRKKSISHRITSNFVSFCYRTHRSCDTIKIVGFIIESYLSEGETLKRTSIENHSRRIKLSSVFYYPAGISVLSHEQSPRGSHLKSTSTVHFRYKESYSSGHALLALTLVILIYNGRMEFESFRSYSFPRAFV